MRWGWLLVGLLGQEIDLEPFLGLTPGRTWSYRAEDGGSRSVSLVQKDAEGALARGSISGGGGQVESFVPEIGLQMHSATLDSGETIEYERPVVLIPARLAPAELHESQRRFVRRRGETKVDVGAHHFEAELLGFEDVETPAGRFERCMKLRRSTVRMDFSGSQERLQLTEWYAEGVGLVKATGKKSWRGVEGGEVQEETLDLVLIRVSSPECARISRSGSTASMGRSTRALAHPKIVTLPPIPTASAATATPVKPGDFRSMRSA